MKNTWLPTRLDMLEFAIGHFDISVMSLRLEQASIAVMRALFEAAGFVVANQVLDQVEVAALDGYLAGEQLNTAGTRGLMDKPWIQRLAHRLLGDATIKKLLPTMARAVQCTLFTKDVDSNWSVPFHQDLSIPVSARVASPACRGWSKKGAILFVQPPVQVLETMLAIRVHLDNCDQSNGALRVLPGTHRLGRLSFEEIKVARHGASDQCITVTRGSAIVMRPLLLHSSLKLQRFEPRRVLHFLVGPADLPEGLRWPEY